MSGCQQVGRPISRCLRQAWLVPGPAAPSMAATRRAFSSSPGRQDEATTTTKPTQKPPPPPPPPPSSEKQQKREQPKDAVSKSPPQSTNPEDAESRRRMRVLDPNVATLHWAEQALMRKGTPPVGSRRRRVALRTSQNIPFEQLPYQAFQEARKILLADREEKLREIVRETARIKNLEAQDPANLRGGEPFKQKRLRSLRKYVEYLKVQADMNDPEIKRRFEDGLGDMSKPIYRFLTEKKWRGLPFRMIQQRISQFHIVPDLLPKFEPRVDVQLFFRQRKAAAGDIVDSLVSEHPPSLRVQVFDPGERLVTVAVVDSDVPVIEKDGFARRCHFLAANVRLDPTQPSVPLGHLNDKKSVLAVPWLPPTAQKGAPYHRLSIFILEQNRDAGPLDVAELRKLYGKRDGFSIKSLRDKFNLEPVGFTLFRSEWDANTAAVMQRHGIPGADVEFRHARVHSLKPPKKERGWEAKRRGPKYKHLWRYTHRIRVPSGKFRR